MIVGLISDTHGLVRPEALDALRGSKRIVHAGDIGRPEVLDRLNGVAPTFAVPGNIAFMFETRFPSTSPGSPGRVGSAPGFRRG